MGNGPDPRPARKQTVPRLPRAEPKSRNEPNTRNDHSTTQKSSAAKLKAEC